MKVLAVLALIGAMSMPLAPPTSATTPDSNRVVAAVWPAGPPVIPYTLYRYSGPLATSARVLAEAPYALGGPGALVALIGVSSKPRVGGFVDEQGRLVVAAIEPSGDTWHLLSVAQPASWPEYAGVLAAAAISAKGGNADDITVQYTAQLSGSGQPTSTAMSIFRRSGALLRSWLNIELDRHYSAGTCCVSGTSATVRPIVGTGKRAGYAVHIASYSTSASGSTRIQLPGALIYGATRDRYALVAYQTPSGTMLSLANLPILALPSRAGDAAALSDPIRMQLPGAVATLSDANGGALRAQLFASWSPGALLLTIRSGPAWPSGAVPASLAVATFPYAARLPVRASFSGRNLQCPAAPVYGGTGFQCQVRLPINDRQTFVDARGATASRLGAQLTYAGATRIALLLTAKHGDKSFSVALPSAALKSSTAGTNTVLLLRE